MGGKWDSFKTLSLGSGPYVGPEWPTLDMHTRAQRDNRCASWGPRGWVLQPRGGGAPIFFCLCREFWKYRNEDQVIFVSAGPFPSRFWLNTCGWMHA